MSATLDAGGIQHHARSDSQPDGLNERRDAAEAAAVTDGHVSSNAFLGRRQRR
jgi:hypothetical protein